LRARGRKKDDRRRRPRGSLGNGFTVLRLSAPQRDLQPGAIAASGVKVVRSDGEDLSRLDCGMPARDGPIATPSRP
jgi:hypothetical protein